MVIARLVRILAKRAFPRILGRYTSGMNGIPQATSFLLQSLPDATEQSMALNQESSTAQVIGLLILAGLVVVTAYLFFLWAIKDRQFEEVEEISKRVLELDAEQNHAEQPS